MRMVKTSAEPLSGRGSYWMTPRPATRSQSSAVMGLSAGATRSEPAPLSTMNRNSSCSISPPTRSTTLVSTTSITWASPTGGPSSSSAGLPRASPWRIPQGVAALRSSLESLVTTWPGSNGFRSTSAATGSGLSTISNTARNKRFLTFRSQPRWRWPGQGWRWPPSCGRFRDAKRG